MLQILLLVSCSRTAPPRVSDAAVLLAVPTSSAAASASASLPTMWAEGVTPYPGAKALCVEHLTLRPTTPGDEKLPWREINWSSFAVDAPAAHVVAFYKQIHPDVKPSVDGPETVFSLSTGARLSVFALPTVKDFPSCQRAVPGPLDRALIVIHRQTVR
jgi:hypothetical protein